MGDVGDEIATDSFELAQVRNIVQHDDGAGVFRGLHGSYGCREEMLPQRSGDDFGFHARRTLQDRARSFDKLRLAHGLHEGTAGLRRHSQFQDFREAFVGEDEALAGIHHGDALHHAAENRGGEVALLSERANCAVQVGRRIVQRSGQSFEGVAGTIRLDGAKISFGNAARKGLQSFHTARKRAGDQERHCSRNNEHDERGKP